MLFSKADCGYKMMFEKIMVSKGITAGAIIKGIGLTIIPEIAVKKELETNELVTLSWIDELETGICMI